MIPVPPFIARAVHAWRVWSTKQRLYRAMPELREQDRQLADARRRHASTRFIEAEKRRIVMARLRVEVAR